MKLFREKLDEINPNLLLTAAVAADKPNLDNFDINNEQKYLNWFNLMTYDFHGSWDKATGHHTNLFSSPVDTTENGKKLSLNKTVKYFIDSLGVDRNKLVPGAAFYGKCWFNVDSTNKGLYQPGIDSGGAYESGLGNYSNLRFYKSMGYEYYWDSVAMAPWLYNTVKKIFWTFDDEKSIALKSRYVDAYNLRGIMFWEISEDDSAGTLVKTIYNRNMRDVKIKNVSRVKSSPSIKIIQPQNEESFSKGSDIIINSSVFGRNSRVIKVELFGDNISLGYNTIAPFNWVWFNVPVGKHKIKAVATDENGNKKISKEVSIKVH
jgi:GH18 family chitinase